MSKTSQESTIFLNTGRSFNKDELVFVPLNKHGNYFEVTVTVSANTIGIRFDPYEGYACIISNLKIIIDEKKIDYTYINGEKLGKVLIFDNLDPQVAIDFNGRTVSKVKITGNIYQINPDDIFLLSQYGKSYRKKSDDRRWIRAIFKIFNLHIFCLRYLLFVVYLKKRYNKTSQVSTIFLNTGRSFNKDEFVLVPLKKYGDYFEVIEPVSSNVIGIRFDPYEGYACIISNLKIITDGDKFDYTYINGEKLGKVLIFDNLDPQVVIDFNGRTVSKVKITGNIYQINPDDVFILSKYRKAYKKYFDNRKWIEKILNTFNLHIFCLRYLKYRYNKNYTGRLCSPNQRFIRSSNIRVLFKKKIKLSYSPLRFDNDKSKSNIIEGKIYTQYAVELGNAMFFSSSNLIFFGGKAGKVLYDLPFYDNEHRFRYSDPEIITLKRKKVTFWKKHEEKIEKAIWMGGCASYNYYHFFYEFAMKFILLNKINIPEDIPVYMDQICFDIPQFKELFDIMNIKKYPLIAVSKNYSYIAKKLYYINCPHIIPPNFIDDNDIRFKDMQFDISGLKELRDYLLPYSSKNSFPKKIFISRRNASGLRTFNEEEIIALLTEFGFEVVFPEKLSFRDQIALFNQAEIIIGGSGAAFTNILFCNEQCKCFVLAKSCLPLSIFSTIAHIVGADLRYITEEATNKNIQLQSIHDPFNIDVTHLKNLLFTFGINV
jgi:hypothetical protein